MNLIRDAAQTVRVAEKILAAPRKRKQKEFPDYSDIIHVEPRTWGREYAAPTSRPWAEGAGLEDDDPSGIHPNYTNREWESMLDEARANGQVVHLRAQLGRQRMPGATRYPMGDGYAYNSSQESRARSFNNQIAREERAKFKQHYPNGCPCMRCDMKREHQRERRKQRGAQ